MVGNSVETYSLTTVVTVRTLIKNHILSASLEEKQRETILHMNTLDPQKPPLFQLNVLLITMANG